MGLWSFVGTHPDGATTTLTLTLEAGQFVLETRHENPAERHTWAVRNPLSPTSAKSLRDALGAEPVS